MKNQLIEMDSNLKDAKGGMFSSHNQFLNIAVLFGLLGLLWFLFAIIYPPLKLNKFNDYFFLVFFIIMIVSMLTDDTLNTQPGATFVSFFYALFLWGRKNEQAKV
jgi:hypothetical protein